MLLVLISFLVDYVLEGSTFSLSKCGFSRLFHPERLWHTYRFTVVFVSGRQNLHSDARVFSLTSFEGDIVGTQYRNTVRKIGKYRNTVSKMDEIPIPHYDRWRYLTLYPSRVFFLSSIYTPEMNLSLREKSEKISNWSVQRSKCQVIGCPTNFVRNCVFNCREV